MSGVMSPVGSEEPRVYWVRRGIVAVVLLALVITVVAAVNAMADGGNSAGDTPPAGSSTGPSLQPAETSTPETPAKSGTPATTASPSASSESGSPKPPESPKPSDSSDASDGSKKPADPKSSKSKPDESPSSSKPAAPVACDGKDVTVSLDGPDKVSLDKPVTFKVTLTNSGSAECKITADADNYEMRIFSGTDRIWTTDKCPQWVKSVSKTLKPKESVSWDQGWRVVRSKGCDDHPSELRPGTYAVNAEFSGAKPSQVVMQLS